MGTGKPSIAILMAVYEPRLDWLRQQLCSLNEQTYPNLRLYIRDDCSPTVPYEEIERCVGECITKFSYTICRNERNLGSNGTFERLTQEAEGDYFAYCDQDDVWLPEKLEVLVREILKRKATMSYSDVSVIDGEGRQVADSLCDIRPRLRYLDGCGLAAELFFRNCVAGCTMLIDAKIAKNAVPFPKDTVCDQWLALLAATEGEIAFSKQTLVQYRQHKHNQTGVLQGVDDKDGYYRYKIRPLGERLAQYRKHTVPQEEIEEFVQARINRNMRAIWKNRRLARYEAEFEIALRVLPECCVRWLLRRVR